MKVTRGLVEWLIKFEGFNLFDCFQNILNLRGLNVRMDIPATAVRSGIITCPDAVNFNIDIFFLQHVASGTDTLDICLIIAYNESKFVNICDARISLIG